MTLSTMSLAEPLVITHSAPDQLLSLNQRLHWAVHARAVREWRYWACVVALNQHGRTGPALGPSVVTVELPVRDKRRRDPHNYIATVKPIIDGLVDAGLWPDDTPEWVSVAEPRLIVRRDGVVRIVITPKSHGEPFVSPVQPQSPAPASVDTSDTETTKESK